jgi:hypothetical protein
MIDGIGPNMAGTRGIEVERKGSLGGEAFFIGARWQAHLIEFRRTAPFNGRQPAGS